MILGYSQYGEDAMVAPLFFGQGRRGLVVDVGAGDGVFLSNSRGAIAAGWSGILIDPLPRHIDLLDTLYRQNPFVRVIQTAIGKAAGTGILYPALDDSFNSTLIPSWRDVAKSYGEPYGDPITVKIRTLTDVLDSCHCKQIDLLVIDAEMMDVEVLESLDWTRWRPTGVIVEGGGPDAFMKARGYRMLGRTKGNTVWASS